MKEYAELAVDLAESIDPITSGDPGSDPTPFLPEPTGLYKVLKQPRTVKEVDAHFASVIAASLKAQGAAFRQRQVIPQLVQLPLVKQMTICRPYCLLEFAIAMPKTTTTLLLKFLSHLVQAVAVKAPVSSATQIKLHLVSCHPP